VTSNGNPQFTIDHLAAPVTEPFDCGREDQTRFLREHAWDHQLAGFSQTYILRAGSKLAGFITLALSEVALEPGEKPAGAPVATLPAVKLVQMGIATEYQGRGLGQELFAFAVRVAIRTGEQVGCRYLILDSVPENVEFYRSKCGCVVNEGVLKTRRNREKSQNRDPDKVNQSMRFDLREPGKLNPTSLSSPKKPKRTLATLIGFGDSTVFVTWFRRGKTKK
jgi:GNAT superfamily N-acetyltransferase